MPSSVIDSLERWLARRYPSALAGLNKGASAAKIAKAEKEIGIALPSAMHALYIWRDGTSENGVSLAGNMRFLSLFDAAAMRATMTELAHDGTFTKPDWWHSGWLPFFARDGGNALLWDSEGSFKARGGKRGQVVLFLSRDAERDIVAPSFEVWLEVFVASLQAGHWKYDAEAEQLDSKSSLPRFMKKAIPGYPK